MQFLLRISLADGIWRLDALDGRADLAHTAALIRASFGYAKGQDFFKQGDKTISAGVEGQADSAEGLNAFESWLGDAQSCCYVHVFENGTSLEHEVSVMKREEKLFCLLPSVIVGAGKVPNYAVQNIDEIRAFADRDENLTLDIREATQTMRALGSLREDVNAAMVEAGATPLNFKRC